MYFNKRVSFKCSQGSDEPEKTLIKINKDGTKNTPNINKI